MPSPPAPAPGSVHGRALVVEDEPHIRELVSLHLGLEGLQVSTAADGQEALRLAAAEAVRRRRAGPDAPED